MNGATFAEALKVSTIEEVIDAVRSAQRLLPRGGGTKPVLSQAAGATPLEMAGLAGITEYQPSEFTFTALAGTRLSEIAAALAEHGQALPFDPPLVQAGSTLGGAIASGLSGSGRHRYGGIRDFLLGVRFVDGSGRLVRGGGKVVKNAAGFDLPKLMIGSLGRLGVIVEASFKVFPQPAASATVQIGCRDLADLHATLLRPGRAPLDVDALDVTPDPPALWVRLAGPEAVLEERAQRLIGHVGAGAILPAQEAAAFWQSRAGFEWAQPELLLAKVGLTPKDLFEIDPVLAANGAQRSYAAGGHLGWVAWPRGAAELDGLLQRRGLSGLLLRGEGPSPLIGVHHGGDVLARVKAVLDPQARFPDFRMGR